MNKNLISENEYLVLVDQAKKSGKSIEDLLISEGKVDPEQLTQIKGQLLHLPYVNLLEKSIPKNVLKIIPKKVSQNYQIVPFERVGDTVKIAMVDPQNYKAIEAIEFLAQEEKIHFDYYITSPASFRSVFKKYDILSEEAREAMESIEPIFGELESRREGEKEDIEETIKSAPVSKMVLVIIRHAIDGRASDIHIEPTMTETRVRYRIDGVLHTSLILPKYIHSAIVSRIKVMSNLKLDETRKPQDGRIRLTIDGKHIDFRVSTLPLYEGEKVVMRILEAEGGILSLAELGFNKRHVGVIERGIKKPHGLTLITGPTGSGKTSTLYTILSMLNQEGVNIITLEDPVEYYVNGINQSQIRPEVGYTFASGLRSILRQDPNIIMLGEIRDQETTELVVHASLTGHIVLSTLHTNDSLGAVPRLIDLQAQPFLLASIMNLVIAQRLARRICTYCRTPVDLPQDVVENTLREIEEIPEVYLKTISYQGNKPVFYKGAGCSKCGGSGYHGRIAIAEIVEFTEPLQQMIVSGFHISEVREELKKQHFITLRQDGILKSLQGIIALEEVYRVSQI